MTCWALLMLNIFGDSTPVDALAGGDIAPGAGEALAERWTGEERDVLGQGDESLGGNGVDGFLDLLAERADGHGGW